MLVYAGFLKAVLKVGRIDENDCYTYEFEALSTKVMLGPKVMLGHKCGAGTQNLCWDIKLRLSLTSRQALDVQ